MRLKPSVEPGGHSTAIWARCSSIARAAATDGAAQHPVFVGDGDVADVRSPVVARGEDEGAFAEARHLFAEPFDRDGDAQRITAALRAVPM